ncbi:MAG: hypothetical protein ACYTXY_45115, partial [Nostoc sp.]
RETWYHKKGTEFKSPNIIRYADDFVILHENKAVVQRCREIISEWLAGIGLEVKKAEGSYAEGKMNAIWCGLSLSETLREQTHTNCRPPVAEILVGDLNPYSLRSLLWSGIRIPFSIAASCPLPFLLNFH